MLGYVPVGGAEQSAHLSPPMDRQIARGVNGELG